MIPSSWRQGLVGEQRVAQRRARDQRIEVEQRELVDAAVAQLVEVRLGQVLVALDDHFAGGLVDDVDRRDALHGVGADQVVEADLDPLDAGLDDLAHRRGS